MPGYDKASLRFVDYQPGVAKACERARALDATGAAYHRNPSTGVWRLAEKIGWS